MRSLVTHLALTTLAFLWPIATESIRFWQIDSAIEIKVQKNTPPYQAFKQVKNIQEISTYAIKYERVQNLSVDELSQTTIQTPKKLVLLEPLVVRKIQPVKIEETVAEPLDLDWINSLPLRQRIRLEAAQSKYSILNDNIPKAKKVEKPIEVSSDEHDVQIVKVGSQYSLQGAWEITGGLAVTPDHSVELRRIVEGIPKETGEVMINSGLYKINVDGMHGRLVAKMYDKSGQVLGEGTMVLAPDYIKAGKAPKLIIRPQSNYFAGSGHSVYDSSKNPSPPDKMTAKVFQGEGAMDSAEETFKMAGVHRGSATIGEFEAPEFEKTNMILFAGQNFKAPLFPKSMMKALKEIVSEQLSYDLNHPDVPVIWGQVLMDGKAVPGAQVEIESAPGVRVVYFDLINLPDPSLKETTANGLFAIVGAPEGFHALVAKRNNFYFAHNVVVTSPGAVSVANLESTLKTKSVPLRAFDAFTGAPQKANIEMQSVENPIELDSSGWTTLLLPEISRLSLMQVYPEWPYLPAQYIYSDHHDYIHAPLISEEWLVNILQPKWNLLDTELGTVIGFVPMEEFEVYLAGYPDFSIENITYFDAQGVVTDKGVPGGGFIINNIPPGVTEVVVFGNTSEKIYSHVLPVDQKSVSVLTVHEN